MAGFVQPRLRRSGHDRRSQIAADVASQRNVVMVQGLPTFSVAQRRLSYPEAVEVHQVSGFSIDAMARSVTGGSGLPRLIPTSAYHGLIRLDQLRLSHSRCLRCKNTRCALHECAGDGCTWSIASRRRRSISDHCGREHRARPPEPSSRCPPLSRRDRAHLLSAETLARCSRPVASPCHPFPPSCGRSTVPQAALPSGRADSP